MDSYHNFDNYNGLKEINGLNIDFDQPKFLTFTALFVTGAFIFLGVFTVTQAVLALTVRTIAIRLTRTSTLAYTVTT